ncbi:hypothetical protein K443DRAFT_683583 [Laccaria amethystina LaAM-08-1]|uniref:Uncharacterized protein n=1 Tax=Laccaria amethystina LaAM-08-1 TaxID=1095629 RepID=A0A0C9WSI7_9AGAR|nr:hypothetical protein K443DRAFT_683583 [Laccaria amethystina LaAM-08-1]
MSMAGSKECSKAKRALWLFEAILLGRINPTPSQPQVQCRDSRMNPFPLTSLMSTTDDNNLPSVLPSSASTPLP